METNDKNEPVNNDRFEQWRKRYEKSSKRGKIFGGFLLIIIGIVLIARQSGALMLPDWLFSWPMILIIVGLFVGVKHAFSNPGWLIPLVIGSIFLADRALPDTSITTYIWPIIIITIGLIMLFKPRRNWERCGPRGRYHWRRRMAMEWQDQPASAGDEKLEVVSIFGGVKKNIISKDFKGGEVTCIFGGCELNLSQADINGTVELEMTCIFGGTQLIVPRNWEVRPELSAILGGVEDERAPYDTTDHTKILVLRGTAVLGGINIKSY